MRTDPPQETFKSFELAAWEHCAEGYGNSFALLTLQAGEALARALSLSRGMKALDIACGPGHLVARIAATGVDAAGVDFSPAMVALAKEQHPGLVFEVGDAESLAYDDESFDAAVINFGVLHLDRPEKAISEAYRVLRKGGRFGFSVWAHPSAALGFQVILEAIEEHGDKSTTLPPGPPFFKYSDAAAGEALLTSAGFTELAARKVPLTWNLDSPETFFTAFFTGTARTGGLLRAQPAHCLDRIRQAVIARALQRFGTGREKQISVPMAAMIYSASKLPRSES